MIGKRYVSCWSECDRQFVVIDTKTHQMFGFATMEHSAKLMASTWNRRGRR